MNTASDIARSLGSSAETLGVRVVVQPRYVPEQSDPLTRRFIFAYRIRITNSGKTSVRLLSRAWTIVDANGQTETVRGEGVVGQQPRIEPGHTHEYSSFCPMRTPWGTMEGQYTFERNDGSKFDAEIARFYLVAPDQRG